MEFFHREEDTVPNDWSFNWLEHYGLFVFTACVSMVLASTASLWLVYKHLMHYKHPRVQRYIVRIILMVPVYAFTSFLSLVWESASIYVDMVRDCYEAYVLYQFFALLIEFVNSHVYSYDDEMEPGPLEVAMAAAQASHSAGQEPAETTLMGILRAKPEEHHPWPMNYVIPHYHADEAWLRHVKRMILQYVLVKPLLAVLATVLEIYDVYDEGSLAPWSGYLYVTIVANISVTLSMYYLVVFYHVIGEELKPLNPFPKFLCIKTVILFAFWQTVVIAIASKIGLITVAVGELGEDELDWATRGLNDWLICLEMLPIAIGHSYAFGYKTYKRRRVRTRDWIPCFSILCCPCHFFSVCCNLGHVVSQGDVISESVDVFNVRNLPGAVSQLSAHVLNAGATASPTESESRPKPAPKSFPGLEEAPPSIEEFTV